MAAVNKVTLLGHVGRDPEMRRTQSGTPVTNFSLATTEKFKGKDGEMKEETEWHNIVAFNKSAETLAKFVKKGSQLYIEGKMKTNSWEDNGVKRYKTEVHVMNFQFLGGKTGDDRRAEPAYTHPPHENQMPADPAGYDTEQLPF